MNSLINIINLNIFFDNKKIIDNLNLEIYENEILTIIGKSGVGKTSLLKAILNLTPYTGKIQINNSTLSYMPQELALFEFKTVYDNIILPFKIKDLKIDDSYVDIILKDLEIFDLKYKKVSTLSGGQRSKVALGRALILKDNLLILDEPLSHLDYLTKQDILKLLKILKKKYNISIIYVTHDINEVLKISDRVLILKDNPTLIVNKGLNENIIINKIIN